MKFVELPPLVRDLLERRGRSILDPWPAIERLDRELEMVEILEEPAQEDGRIFPIVTKVYLSATRRPVERELDGSLPPVPVVRFPVIVEDPEEWSRHCRAWREAHPSIETTDEVCPVPDTKFHPSG
jgi:hypothetical protein